MARHQSRFGQLVNLSGVTSLTSEDCDIWLQAFDVGSHLIAWRVFGDHAPHNPEPKAVRFNLRMAQHM
ncbi:hypothetical protein CNR27_14735 [Luteimonas chenhongjianii]|uniref:Uncharacterized protein n=1 Tax=Luteimonas chenhongjianii TaxID=2006110 RepID=A0A290XHB4_9GAMM|nr:hypothetical protein CNR27_14735 [Luteimonas chenhongjianii]